MTEIDPTSSAAERAAPAGTGERIVVGVDGSDGALSALRWALREARFHGAQIHPVYAWQFHRTWGDPGPAGLLPTDFRGAGSPVNLPSELQSDVGVSSGELGAGEPAAGGRIDAHAAATNILEHVVSTAVAAEERSIDLSGLVIKPEAIEGHAAQVLLDFVSDTDLLVVGSRGHGRFAAALLGSISQHVVSHSRCPVVVVPDRTRG